MKLLIKIFLISTFLFISCNRGSEKAKETINNGGEASYCDFEFDKRTYIGVRNKVVIE